MTTHSFTIEFTSYRCPQCRRYFEVESGEKADCGFCLRSRLNTAELQLQVSREENSRLRLAHHRTVAALKGAITKAKRK